jgi:hypothetical protein
MALMAGSIFDIGIPRLDGDQASSNPDGEDCGERISTPSRSAAVSETSRSTLIKTGRLDMLETPVLSNLLRLVGDDTAALRQSRNLAAKLRECPVPSGNWIAIRC